MRPMTSYRIARIEQLRAFHQTATTTKSYETWLEAVRSILKQLPTLLDEIATNELQTKERTGR
jgi:hypothetical protein